MMMSEVSTTLDLQSAYIVRLRKDRVMSASISMMLFPGQKLKSHKCFSFTTSILSFTCPQSANNSLFLESHYL